MSDPNPDQQSHRTLQVADAPFDAANQSLADALRASFGVLKAIMIVLVVWFLLSGLTCVQENEQAVVFRLGKLQPAARDPGLSWAFPYPLDEMLEIGVTAETLTFDSHWFHVGPEEKTASLRKLESSRGGQGLDPVHDGALLTADKGLAHVKWSLVYRITDLSKFVRNVSHAVDESTRKEMTRTLIQTLLENAAIRAASGFTAAQITQTQTDAFAREVKRILNTGLEALQTGVVLTTVEIPIATVPLQTRRAFLAVTEAESRKKIEEQKADQERNDLLNKTAGAVYPKLLARLDEADAARAAGDTERLAEMEREIDRILSQEASGAVGSWIRDAEANYTRVVQGLRGDVEEYEKLVGEYEQTPRLLIERLWQETKQRVLSYPGVTKYWLPAGQKEVRIKIGPDPRARREAEIEEYKEKKGSQFEEPPPQYEIVVPDGVTAGPSGN